MIEYAEADVRACGEIYLQQLDDYARDENKSLQSILDLSHEELLTLVHMERNGINVDLNSRAGGSRI